MAMISNEDARARPEGARGPFGRCLEAVPLGLALVVIGPTAADAQQMDTEAEVRAAVELRVELGDRFPGPMRRGEAGTWTAEYVEAGEWTFAFRGNGGVDLDPRHDVVDLSARASPILEDACGNAWVRRWEDPARVEFPSEVTLEPVMQGEALAIWYRPVRASLVDPGGPTGEGDCYDRSEEDERTRSDLLFDASDLSGRIATESGLPAVRDDGGLLLAIVSRADLEEGERIRRRVSYQERGMRFRAVLRLHPEP